MNMQRAGWVKQRATPDARVEWHNNELGLELFRFSKAQVAESNAEMKGHGDWCKRWCLMFRSNRENRLAPSNLYEYSDSLHELVLWYVTQRLEGHII